MKQELLATVRQMSSGSVTCRDLDDFQAKLSVLKDEGGKLQMGLRILKSLRFLSMELRQTNIEIAYTSTYEWILGQSPEHGTERLKFAEWLETQHGIFWINGKAGSGKSTLIKFILGHKDTSISLHTWVRDLPLVTANFSSEKLGISLRNRWRVSFDLCSTALSNDIQRY